MGINVGNLEWDAYIKDTEFQAQLNRIEQRLGTFDKNVQKSGNNLEGYFKKAAVAAAGFFSISAAQGFVKQLVQVRGEFEQLEIAFSTILGSKQRADSLMKELVEFAGTTPFGLQDTASAAKQLLAYGSNAKDVTNELRMLGDVASGVSAPINELVYLYGTLRTQGRAYMMDIRQFAGRGIPIYKELATVLGVAEGEVNNLVTAGKVGFAEIEQSFKNMTAAGSTFGGLMEAQSNSIVGQLERLADAWDVMLNEMGKGNQTLIGDTISGLSYLVENYETVLDILSSLVVAYGAYRAALIVTTAIEVARATSIVRLNAIQALSVAGLNLMKRAQLAFNVVASVNPYVLLATSLAGLVTYLALASDGTDDLTASQKALKDVNDSVNKSIEEEHLKTKQLLSIAQDETASKKARIKAIEDLNRISPEHLGNLKLDKINTIEAKDAVDLYIDSLKRLATEKAINDKRVELNKQIIEIEMQNRGDFGFIDGMMAGAKSLVTGQASASILLQTEKVKGLYDALNDLDGMYKELHGSQDKTLTDGEKQAQVFTSELKDVITNFDSLIKSATNKSDISKIKEAVQGQIDALSPDDSKIREYQDKLKQVSEIELKYSLASNSKAEKEAEKWGDKKLDILNKIADKEAEIRAKGKTQDEKEIEDAKNKYAELRRIIEEYNAKAPKAKQIGTETLNRLDNAEKTETGDISYRQSTEKLKEELKRQQDIHDQFEQYRIETSYDAAKQRFENEKDFVEDYTGLLQKEIDNLNLKQISHGLTGSESERLKLYSDQLADFNNNQKKQQDDVFKQSYALAQSYEESVLNLQKKYQDAKNSLGANITADQIKVLDSKLKAEQDALNRSLIEELDSYKYFFENLADLSGDRLKDAAAAIEKDFADLVALYPELKKFADILTKRVIGAKTAKTAEDFRDMADSLSFMADAVQDFGGGLADAFRAASDLAGQVSNLKNDMAAFNAAMAIGNSLGGIASGLGIIGAGFNIMSTLNNFLDRTTASDEQRLRNSELQLQATEGMTKALERQIKIANEAYGTQKIEEYTKAVEQANKTIDESGKALSGRIAFIGDAEIDKVIEKINKGEKLSGWSLWGNSEKDLAKIIKSYPKLTTDENELQRLLDAGKLDSQTAQIAQNFINAHDAIKESERAIMAFQTGIDFDTLSDNLIDAISSGNDAIKELGDNFEETMKNAILNSLKDGQFKKEMEAWYESFNAAYEGGFTDTELAKLREDYMKIGERQRDKLLAYEKATGLDLDGSQDIDKNGLTKSITGITETTANRLEGEFGGLRLAQLQLLETTKSQTGIMQQYSNYAFQNLNAALAIERNTFRTAENTQHLSRLAGIETAIISLNNKVSNTDALARGAGF